MAIRFSDQTKRNIWMMVGVAAVIAMLSGTWAMLSQVLGWDEETPRGGTTAKESGLLIPQGPVSGEAVDWFEEDLGTLERPYPEGSGPWQVEELLPHVRGATLIDADQTSLTLEYPALYVDGEAEVGENTYAVYRRGDIAVLEALQWRCAWAEAFVQAEEDGDSAAAALAREHLEAFPTLTAVEGLPAAKQNATELEPVLEGDHESAAQWVAEKCVARPDSN